MVRGAPDGVTGVARPVTMLRLTLIACPLIALMIGLLVGAARAVGAGLPHEPLLAYIKAGHGIYLLDADRAQHTLLVRDRAVLAPLAWSPDGNWLAYATRQSGAGEIYLFDLTTGRCCRNVSDHPADDGAPAWSATGDWLAFVSLRDGNFEVYVRVLPDNTLHNITRRDGGDYEPVWSRDGYTLSYESMRDSRRQVLAVDVPCAFDATCTPVTLGRSEYFPPPTFTPDAPPLFVAGVVGDIFMRRDGESHRLTRDGINFAPAWQPGR